MFAQLAVLCVVAVAAHAGVVGYGGAYGGYGGAYGGYGGAIAAAPAYGHGLGYGGAAFGHGIGYAAPAVAKVAVAAAPVVAKVAIAHAPQPYEFGYNRQHEDGAQVHRQETSDGVRQQGSYGYTGPDGIYRHVEYIADELGFRANIKTNEPGTANQNPAAVGIAAAEPPYKVLPAAAPIIKAVAPVALAAAPVVKAIAAPIGYGGYGGHLGGYGGHLGGYGGAYGGYGGAAIVKGGLGYGYHG